jgi:hypothetical protein
MRLLVTGYDVQQLREDWEKLGCAVQYIHESKILQTIVTNRNLVCDAIIFLVDSAVSEEHMSNKEKGIYTNQNINHLWYRIRKLGEAIAMPDGKKWNRIPLISVELNGPDFLAGPGEILFVEELDPPFVINFTNAAESLKFVKEVIREYVKNLLSQLDNLGLIVTYDKGRFRVGPALKPKEAAEDFLYLGTSDKRTDFVTVDRDNYGINLEIELFEELINKDDVDEDDFQEFFEKHPYFLPMQGQQKPRPHVRLKEGHLIPDFILEPVYNFSRDSNWEIFDIKLPDVKLLTKHKQHPRLSADVHQAITQLRDYGKFFRDPSYEDEIVAKVGRHLRFPRLGVLIGRMPKEDADKQLLNDLQNDENDVRLVTYDEILDAQKGQLI